LINRNSSEGIITSSKTKSISKNHKRALEVLQKLDKSAGIPISMK